MKFSFLLVFMALTGCAGLSVFEKEKKMNKRMSKQTKEQKINAESIRNVIRKNSVRLQSCYRSALKKTQDLTGKMVFQWEILDEKVQNIVIKRSSIKNKTLTFCLISLLKEMRFTDTGLEKGQVGVITFPFAFQKK